ncbi:MAG: S-layer homology domain-containing protein [Clostridiaceae bacterium]|nr:S-layer homology domain-containing protein [Clostridiaceae bacterium]
MVTTFIGTLSGVILYTPKKVSASTLTIVPEANAPVYQTSTISSNFNYSLIIKRSSTPRHHGNNVPPITDTIKEKQQVVTEDKLIVNKDGKIIVIVEDGKNNILLPISAANIINMANVELRIGNVTVTIPAEVIKALVEAMGKEIPKDSQISVKIETIVGDAKKILEGKATIPSGILKVVGEIYNFELSGVTTSGKETKLTSFSKPIKVTIPYNSNQVNEDLLGVYFYNDKISKWEYVGGKIDKVNKKMEVDLSHFSTYGVLEYNKTFADVAENYWAYNTIKILSAKHIINGFDDNRFAPMENTTRAEFVAMISRMLGLKATSKVPFSDVDGTKWYAADVAAAFEAKLITGKTTTTFEPESSITREEMAALTVRVYEMFKGNNTVNPKATFADYNSVSEWAKGYVDVAYNIGLMRGNESNLLNPTDKAIRSEVAQVILNLYKVIK